jgi:predicted homoserine dehydrogenase-like protein
MQHLALFRDAIERPVAAGLAGGGEFGISLIAQSRRLKGLSIRAVMDRDVARVAKSLAAMGVEAKICESARDAKAAWDAGAIAVCGRIDDLLALPIEILVEATGDAEAGARHAAAAIAAGRGVAMVTKEAECVVGPALARRARAAGVPYTLVDGDQPSLLIGLVSRARLLGLPIVAAGKSSEYDFVFDPVRKTLTWRGETIAAPDLAQSWLLDSAPLDEVLARRSRAMGQLPQRVVPDSCEMCLVANATGLAPDRPDFHAPLARPTELPDIYIPRSEGGVLQRSGIIDVFNCLRRPDEASFAGGVFVVVELADTTTGELFRGKGIPTSRKGRHSLIYNPSHLLGVEAPVSIMAAARLRHCMVDETYRPVCDLVARVAKDLPAGTRLDIVGNRHAVPDVGPGLVARADAQAADALPYYMAVGRTLNRTVKSGAMVTFADVAAPDDSLLWTLRREQDAAFPVRSAATVA